MNIKIFKLKYVESKKSINFINKINKMLIYLFLNLVMLTNLAGVNSESYCLNTKGNGLLRSFFKNRKYPYPFTILKNNLYILSINDNKIIKINRKKPEEFVLYDLEKEYSKEEIFDIDSFENKIVLYSYKKKIISFYDENLKKTKEIKLNFNGKRARFYTQIKEINKAGIVLASVESVYPMFLFDFNGDLINKNIRNESKYYSEYGHKTIFIKTRNKIIKTISLNKGYVLLSRRYSKNKIFYLIGYGGRVCLYEVSLGYKVISGRK